MGDTLLQIRNLHVSVEEKDILKGIDLDVKKGETHVLMGPNGAGKSTLGNALMGNPHYIIKDGTVTFDGKNLLEEPVNQRAKDGLFMSFQNPLEVPGISLSNFIRNALEQRTGERIRLFKFRKQIQAALELLNMDPSYADRDLNVGFSGGEKKKAEILQLLMLNPSLAILDETDSGLDVDAVRTVSKGIQEFQQNHEGALIIITHSTRILESLKVDHTHVLVNGKIVENGDGSLVDEINENGFERFEKMAENAE
ncbi:MAG: Fe-S cluster assembly ATPase SufC [Eubacteriales bacterium]|nr:Fe-S cluster assembly ATPase SufC [Eubacteriales bacterium]